MDIEEAQNNQDSWGSCPVELLLNIFEYLDAKELLACMGVNKRWRSIVDDWGEKSKKWLSLLENMPSRGLKLRQRSILKHRELYLNYRIWFSVKNAQVNLKHIYQSEEVLNIHVYKDTLIVVCKDNVKFFDIKEGVLINETCEAYLDYEETDYLVSKVTEKEGKKHVEIYSKLHDNKKLYECQGFHHLKVLHEKCCLIDDMMCAILMDSSSDYPRPLTRGKFYDYRLVCDMLLRGEYVFFYTDRGDVFQSNPSQLNIERYCSVDVPVRSSYGPLDTDPEFKAMIRNNILVYSVRDSDREGLVRHMDAREVTYILVFYKDLACAMEHDDFLLLGFENGKIGVVIIPHLLENHDVSPIFQFHLQCLAPTPVSEQITRIEVHEDQGFHHIFAATKSNVYQFAISHADYKKVMP